MAEYYDMQEVMGKLRKTEEDVQELVKQGKLHQYMDSGKAVFKTEDVDALAEEVVGLDITSFGLDSDGSELNIEMEETSEIQLEPDEEGEEASKTGGPDDMDLDIQPDIAGQQESEGGFGLSQMGDLTMGDTNVGTVGINILSGTGDAYQLTEDTKAETKAADIDDLDSLDADANLESFGSGSGLLDLSLQADDTSLGAVLDDILPTGAEGAGGADLPVDEGLGLMDESEDILSGGESVTQGPGGVTAPMGAAAVMPTPTQIAAVAPVDPKTNIFGVLMFLPLLALILASIVLTGAIQNVVPSLVKILIETEVMETVGLIWVIVGGLAVLLLLILMIASLGGGGGTKTKKTTRPKKEKKARKKRK